MVNGPPTRHPYPHPPIIYETEFPEMFSFRLPEGFVASYATREVNWGFPVADGVSLGEITFLRTYSRVKPDGQKEQWHEVCERVIEGMFSILKDHCLQSRLPWDDDHGVELASEAYDRLFNGLWSPPGRGLWTMGTPLTNAEKNSAALQNCAFLDTGVFSPDNPAGPYHWLMEASMLGIGVGLNTAMGKAGLTVHDPSGDTHMSVIPDTREGWCDSVAALINSYLVPGSTPVDFDYSLIRPAGAPIKTFGGVAAGPEPLQRLHREIRRILGRASGKSVGTELVADLANLIGVCVVAGNVRRSALLILGDSDDEVFRNLKNAEMFPERNSFDPEQPGWGYMSNNSISAHVGMDYKEIEATIVQNGEPGVIWMDTVRRYGRSGEVPAKHKDDSLVAGFNPCAEIALENRELCTLAEIYLPRHESMESFLRTVKMAFLYGKAVTLLPTHWPETNAVMARNRRIGLSLSGIAEFADNHGIPTLRDWMDTGYRSVQDLDTMYSRWLCVRESVRTTTVKPSGTVSILAGVTPGVHWAPGGKRFMRTIRFSALDPTVALLADAGYRVEDDVVSAGTKVVYFPVETDQKRAERDVSIFEKAALAATAQTYWADNSVSVTVSFDPETEAQHIATVLHMYEGTLKSVSFLPSGNAVYPQMPYTSLTEDEYRDAVAGLKPVDLATLYVSGEAEDAVGESGCTTDKCEITGLLKALKDNAEQDKEAGE